MIIFTNPIAKEKVLVGFIRGSVAVISVRKMVFSQEFDGRTIEEYEEDDNLVATYKHGRLAIVDGMAYKDVYEDLQNSKMIIQID